MTKEEKIVTKNGNEAALDLAGAEALIRAVLELDEDADLAVTEYRESVTNGGKFFESDDLTESDSELSATTDESLAESDGRPESKTDVMMSGWGGLDKEVSPPCDRSAFGPGWTESDDIEYLSALVHVWRKEKGEVAYARLKLFVWLFALDQPAGQSRRGLIMIWLMVQHAKMVLNWRMLKLYLAILFGGCDD